MEFNTYTVRCHIEDWRVSEDGDYHLVLSDVSDPSAIMIGEIPCAECGSVQQSNHLAEFIQARKNFEGSLDSKKSSTVYTITGVAFFDKIHKQFGAKNGIEIHPVLSITENKNQFTNF